MFVFSHTEFLKKAFLRLRDPAGGEFTQTTYDEAFFYRCDLIRESPHTQYCDAKHSFGNRPFIHTVFTRAQNIILSNLDNVGIGVTARDTVIRGSRALDLDLINT